MSFAAAFGVAWFTRPSPEIVVDKESAAISAKNASGLSFAEQRELDKEQLANLPMVDSSVKKKMTRKQLQSLIYEVREKADEYETKLKAFKVREQRLEMANKLLKKDIDQLENLRTELASVVASLKSQKDQLEKSRIAISSVEKKNLL